MAMLKRQKLPRKSWWIISCFVRNLSATSGVQVTDNGANYIMNRREGEAPSRLTARRHVAKVLTEEIVQSLQRDDFMLATEQQLCQRFEVSRVTIRRALADLVHKGLIYRHHGRGTFAFGSSSRANRSIGIFIHCLETMKLPGFCEVLRGALAEVGSGHASLVILHTPPEKWSSEMTGQLAGVMVLHECVAGGISRTMEEKRLPFLLIRGSQLIDPVRGCFELGQRAAQALNCAPLTGAPPGEIKARSL